MPERRNRRSETGKPAGSIIAASTQRHAQVRIIAPALAAISGSYSARAIGAADMSDALGDTQKQLSQFPVRHCERSEAIQGRCTIVWIAAAPHVVAPGLLRRKGSSQ